MNAEELESTLVGHQEFANGRQLRVIAESYSRFAVEILADDLPEAAALNRAAGSGGEAGKATHVLQSPALRCALDVLLGARAETGDRGGERFARARTVLVEATRALNGREASPPSLLEGPTVSLGTIGPVPVVLWEPGCRRRAAEDLVEHEFKRTIISDLADEGHEDAASLATPTSGEIAVLRQALRFLDNLIPTLASSIVQHVHFVAVMRMRMRLDDRVELLSASNISLPGAIFLSDAGLRSELAAAEAILHEATHQRLYELLLWKQIYAPGYDPDASPQIIPPWYAAESGGGRPWTADRALAALDVYAHLAVLWYAAMSSRERTDRTEVVARLERCLRKGTYLSGLVNGLMRPCLGIDGRRFVEHLANTLDDVARAPRTGQSPHPIRSFPGGSP